MAAIEDDGAILEPLPETHRAGFVSIVGSPNVGKSTMMNHLLGENLSIATAKASTTRHRIMGIANAPEWQIVFSDTPGVVKPKYKLHEGMMGAVRCAIEDSDVILFITDVLEAGFRDDQMLKRVRDAEVPVLVLVNKVDLIGRKKKQAKASRGQGANGGADTANGCEMLEPLAEASAGDLEDEAGLPPPEAMNLESIRTWWRHVLPNGHIFEVSALEGRNVDAVREHLLDLLPVHPPFFDKGQLSDRPERFFAAEFVREQIFEQYQDEVPYCCEVVVESFKESDNKIRCECTVHVMRDSQKGIVIGKKAQSIKAVTERSQRSLYKFFGKRVDLRLQVKVTKNWRTDKATLQEFGYLRK